LPHHPRFAITPSETCYNTIGDLPSESCYTIWDMQPQPSAIKISKETTASQSIHIEPYSMSSSNSSKWEEREIGEEWRVRSSSFTLTESTRLLWSFLSRGARRHLIVWRGSGRAEWWFALRDKSGLLHIILLSLFVVLLLLRKHHQHHHHHHHHHPSSSRSLSVSGCLHLRLQAVTDFALTKVGREMERLFW